MASLDIAVGLWFSLRTGQVKVCTWAAYANSWPRRVQPRSRKNRGQREEFSPFDFVMYKKERRDDGGGGGGKSETLVTCAMTADDTNGKFLACPLSS